MPLKKSATKILYIDTADRKNCLIKINSQSTDVKNGILETIDKVLKKTHTPPENLSEIKVNRGPGSFTSLRVGISIANTLNFALGLKPIEELDTPKYGKPPNITVTKR